MRKLKIESLQSKKQGWVDRDVIMLHSCFQLLKDCVEKENIDTHWSYELPNEFKKPTTHKQTIEDDVMLLRLMKIRTSLWT